MPLENSASSFIGGIYGSFRPKDSNRKNKLSVSEMLAMRDKGGPEMSPVFDPIAGKQLTYQEAISRGPYTTNVARTGMGGGHGYGRGYGGGYRGQSHMSSSGLSSGVPTSRTGRALMGMNPNLSASDTASMEFRGNFGKPLYGNMLPQPLPDPLTASASQGLEKRTNPDGSVSWGSFSQYAKGSEDTGKRDRLAVVGEKGPEIVMMPAHSKVVPNHELPHYATGTRGASDDYMDQFQSALDEVTGEVPVVGAPLEGEIRMDANGNPWRYDATQGRGIPENPYLNRSNAPTPRSAFTTSASARYDDLANRLAALRSEGLAAGRARILGLQQQQAAEQARLDAIARHADQYSKTEGGAQFKTPYGMAIVGGNRPKSFTVESFQGGQQKFPSLRTADGNQIVSQESAADAARRRWAMADASVGTSPRAEAARRGGVATSMAGYRASPDIIPNALSEVIGIDDVPMDVAEVPIEEEVIALPDDRPEVWAAANRRRLGFLPNVAKHVIDASDAPSALAANLPMGTTRPTTKNLPYQRGLTRTEQMMDQMERRRRAKLEAGKNWWE